MKKGIAEKIRAIMKNNLALIGVVAIAIYAAMFVRGFASTYNLRVLIASIAPLAVLSCGVTLPVLNGGTDFSAPAMVTLGSVLGAYLTVKTPLGQSVIGTYTAILMMLALGLILGMINGLAVVILKMPSFIATMGTQMVAQGTAVLFAATYYEKVSMNGLPRSFLALGGGSEFNLFTPLIIMAVILAFTQWLLTCTIFGRRVFAVGTNQVAAYVSGVRVKRIIFTLSAMSGLYAGIASILYTAKNEAGIPTLGDRLFIDVISSIIIGGTSVNGGKGGVIKTLFGVVFITVMDNALVLKGITWYVITLIKGLLVLVLVLVTSATIPVPKLLQRRAPASNALSD